MPDHPFLILLLIIGSVLVFRIWLGDFNAARKGARNPKAFPGATPANSRVTAVAVVGALAILAVETLSEIGLGVTHEQSTLTALFAAYTLCAAFLEELVFRGFIVVTQRGPVVKWAAAVATSVVFALAHPYLWDWDGGLVLNLAAQPVISTLSIFATSLWLYAMRFTKLNPAQSLIPCVAAHLARNAAVILVKAAQGHLAGWF